MTTQRLVLLHGFTQTGTVWDPMIDRLRRNQAPWSDYRTPDAPGHGDATDSRLDLVASATSLAQRFGAATYLGYSMGGRQALHLAVTRPDVVRELVLISTSAGIADEAARTQRRIADDELADRIERIGVDAFLEEWLARPMFRSLDPASAQLEARRANTAAGLASSLRICGAGAQASLWERLVEVTVPTLVIAGERDPAYVQIARELCARLPHGDLVVIEDAGHAVPFERLEPTVDAVLQWSRRSEHTDDDPDSVHDLHPPGRAENGDQLPVGGTAENPPRRA